MRRRYQTNFGFTLIELMVSMAIGLVILSVAVGMFKQAMSATWTASQKSEMQQDFRAASNLLQRDISMAGAGALGQQGLASNSVGLPSGAGTTTSVYPCSLTTCNYINGAPVAYPTACGTHCLYSIIPGYNFGITVNATEGPTDIITVAYADATLPLNCYNITVNTASSITFQLPNPPYPSTCVLPPGVATPPLLNAAGVGLQAGDFILFGQTAAGVVSTVATTAPTAGNAAAFLVTFNAGDPGFINQPTATAGSLNQLPGGLSTTLTAVRLLVITYYLDISPIDGVTPRLMRIQNGKAPAPVAENVTYLKFSYDVNQNGTILADQTSLPAGVTPNMIKKVNILHMTMRSQLKGSGYQGLDLNTSISARNLTMQQEYPISGSAY